MIKFWLTQKAVKISPQMKVEGQSGDWPIRTVKMEGLMKRLFYSLGFSSGLLLCFSLSSLARADGLGMFGASSRATAMGGAMVGIAQGPEAIYYNPSAIALSPNATSLQVSNLNANLYVNGENYGPNGTQNMVGFNYRLLRDRVGVGLLLPLSLLGGLGGGGGGPDDPGTGFNLADLGEHPNFGWPMYGSGMIPTTYALSFRLHDMLSVGISQSMLMYLRFSPAEIDLDAILEGLLGFSLGGEPITEANYNWHIGFSTETGEMGYSATFRPLKYVSFGYTHIGKSEFDLMVPVTLRSALLEYDMYYMLLFEIETTPAIDRLGMGINIPLPRSQLTLAYSQDALMYGDLYKDRYDDWAHCARSVKMDTGGSTFSYPKPSPRENVTIEHFGLEYLLELKGWLPDFLSKRNPELAVRGGYFHWDSPYPDKLWGGSFDNDADVYSGGIGINFDRKSKSQVQDPSRSRWVSIDLHFQYFGMDDEDYKLTHDYWMNPRGPSSVYYYHTEAEITNMGIQLTWWH